MMSVSNSMPQLAQFLLLYQIGVGNLIKLCYCIARTHMIDHMTSCSYGCQDTQRICTMQLSALVLRKAVIVRGNDS